MSLALRSAPARGPLVKHRMCDSATVLLAWTPRKCTRVYKASNYVLLLASDLDEGAEGRTEVVCLYEANGLVKRTLAEFIIGEENRLSHVDIALQYVLHQGLADPGSLLAGAHEDVLEITDRNVIGDSSGQAHQLAIRVPR